MTSRLTHALVFLLLAAAAAAGQDPAAPAAKSAIDRLSAFDYATRTSAARALRRLPASEAVPALSEAARRHPDQYARYRALIVLTSFNDRGTPDLMRALLGDRNDRVREVVYRWFERNPDNRLVGPLLTSLETEQAEFVRPALVRALAALGRDQQIQRALLTEAGRGLDFFRSAVIEALGEHRAAYAVDAVVEVAKLDGPLQDDAVIALGRIGDKRALPALKAFTNPGLELVPPLQAALCLIEDGCTTRVSVLVDTARSRAASREAVRAAVAALGVIAESGHEGATAALVGLAGDGEDRLRNDVALAWSAVALRRPAHAIAWLSQAPEETRAAGIELLRRGFETLEEDFAEEQFFAAARAAYWGAAESSVTRTLTAALIDRLEF